MSNKNPKSAASTQAKVDRASDLTVDRKDSTTSPVSWEAKSPPNIRSVALKLETKQKRRSLFGRSSSCRRLSTVPRTTPTEIYQKDSQDDCRPSTASATAGRVRVSFLGGRSKPIDNASHHEKVNDDPNVFRIRPDDTRHGPSCNSPREQFKTGKQYYRHLKKCSISPPFGFEHIAHTVKEQLSSIKSTDEQDLTARFWSVTKSQTPRNSLRGIQADDLAHRRPSMVFGSMGRSRATSQEPRRRSSASSGNHAAVVNPELRKDSNTLQPTHDGIPNHDPTSRESQYQISPIDKNHGRRTSSARSDAKVRFKTDTIDKKGKETPERIPSVSGKRTMGVLPSLPEQTAFCMESNWEDDVDFCYEQEAEATCEFDWEKATASKESNPLRMEQENRDSVWSTSPVNPSSPRQTQPEVVSHDFADQQYRRGPSVGHRAFLAARGSVQSSPTPISSSVPQTTPVLIDGGILSPTVVLASGDDVSCKPMYRQNTLNHSLLPQSIVDELSDPESIRVGGYRHRKSNSFGSSGSSSARSTRSASDSSGNRWSLSSFASVPELLYSHRRNKTSVSRMRISAPLDSVRSPSKKVNSLDFENPREGVMTKPARHPQTPGERAAAFQKQGTTGRASLRGKSLVSSARRSSPPGGHLRETSTLGNGPEWI